MAALRSAWKARGTWRSCRRRGAAGPRRAGGEDVLDRKLGRGAVGAFHIVGHLALVEAGPQVGVERLGVDFGEHGGAARGELVGEGFGLFGGALDRQLGDHHERLLGRLDGGQHLHELVVGVFGGVGVGHLADGGAAAFERVGDGVGEAGFDRVDLAEEVLVAAAHREAGAAEVGGADEVGLHVGLGQHGLDDGALLGRLGEVLLAQLGGLDGFLVPPARRRRSGT
jgi:hypothetical protein